MILNFNNYINESIKDKLKGKKLDGKSKILYDCIDELKDVGITSITGLKKANNREFFDTDFYYSYFNKNGISLLMMIPDIEIIKWKVFDQSKGTLNQQILIESDNWSEVFDTMIKRFYKHSDIDKLIRISKDNIEESKEMIITEEQNIKNYNNVKKYLQNN